MKKTGIVLFAVIIGFMSGCKKQPAEPVSVSAPGGQMQTAAAAEPANPTEAVQTPGAQAEPKDGIAWMTDFEAAKKKAAAEGKDLFIDFTGSDWCIWCQRLEKEVFSKPIFIHEAQKHFVFVMVDFPRNKKQSKELKAQNERLAQTYQAQAFPTIVLAEADGTPYAQTGYQEGGPLPYLEELARLQKQKPAK